jgi:hypothetical protein
MFGGAVGRICGDWATTIGFFLYVAAKADIYVTLARSDVASGVSRPGLTDAEI